MSGWHIQQNGQAKGPYTDDQLKVLCDTGVVNAATLAWKSAYTNWTPLAQTDFIYKSLLAPPPLRQGAHPATFGGASLPGEDLSLWDYYVRAISEKYAEFHGRARRKEYWSVFLFYLIFLVLALIVGAGIDAAAGHFNRPNGQSEPIVLGIFAAIYILGMLVPGLAVLVRRFHDVGLSGWLVLIGFIPYIGGLFNLVISLIPSERGANVHGPYPKPDRI